MQSSFLQTLENMGYRAFAQKAQLHKTEVTYLSYILKKSQCWLSTVRKETVINIPTLQSPQRLRESLGSMGFYRL